MLYERWCNDRACPVALEAFRPFSRGGDREFWDTRPEAQCREDMRRAEEALRAEWPEIKASDFREFRISGNREGYERLHYRRRLILEDLTVGECLENQGRFLEAILNALWSICEESSWVFPAHNKVQGIRRPDLPLTEEPMVDLFAAETGALLAWTFYLIGDALDALTPLLRRRVKYELNRRLLNPYEQRDDFWWMGFWKTPGGMVNNWNPWINSNILSVLLLSEEDRGRRVSMVDRICRCLDHFLSEYKPDGGCDEGAGYWSRAGGSLLDCLELLRHASGGDFNPFDEELIRNIGSYLKGTHLCRDHLVNFGDGGARVEIYASGVYLYGLRAEDTELRAMAMEAFGRQKGLSVQNDRPEGMFRRLNRYALYDEMMRESQDGGYGKYLYPRDSWLPDLQQGCARSRGGDPEAVVAAFKGGHNNESHNHNDTGSFILFSGGRSFLIDVGVETYTAATFGPERYSLWTMQSSFHNLPEINGRMQRHGPGYRSRDVRYEKDDKGVCFSLGLEDLYPPEAGIKSWRRHFRFSREGAFELEDRFRLIDEGTPCVENLITPWKPQISDDNCILLGDGSQMLRIKVSGGWDIACETISVEDPKLRQDWPSEIYRIRISGWGGPEEGRCRIQGRFC